VKTRWPNRSVKASSLPTNSAAFAPNAPGETFIFVTFRK
jgi:hypothetical protein